MPEANHRISTASAVYDDCLKKPLKRLEPERGAFRTALKRGVNENLALKPR